ncbi:hypothetical protein MMC16_007586, partial [Acarospora aff. strigata]|nr:hypothetical protein [Acarospora aff. strigata]
MLNPEQERHQKFITLRSGGRPIGSLLNPYNAITTSRTPSLRSDAYGSTDSLSSCESTPLIYLHSTPSSTTTSSSADQTSARKRPAYKEEELCFIWYHRVDLKKAWVDVQCAFNAQFPTRQRSGVQGI